MAEEKMVRIWDSCELIGELKKTERTKLRIELVARDGVKYVNIREWYLRKKDVTWMPSIAGFATPIQIPIEGSIATPMNDLIALIMQAVEKSSAFPIENAATAVYVAKKSK